MRKILFIIIVQILNDQDLKNMWELEIKTIAERLVEKRKKVI